MLLRDATDSIMGVQLFMILALVAGIHAGPISDRVSVDRCARECTVSTKFNYEPGTTYEFEYETELQTSVQGASEDHSGLYMTARAHMQFVSKCEVAMTLTDVILKEHDPESSDMKVTPGLFQQAMQANPLRFSYQDGTVEGICVAVNEPTWVANIKRGVVSVFQISMDDIEAEQKMAETDVSGNCEATYTSADKGWHNKLIKKSKNLLGCTERHGQMSAIQGTPYTSTSGVQSLPLVKSTHECEHEIVKSTGRLQKAMCKEQHMFAPFSRESSGAVTTNTQRLTFMKQTNARAKQVPFESRGSLKFEHAYDADKSASNMKDLERKLMEICQTTKSGVRPETPGLFTSLVHTMKTMSASDMTTVYQKVTSGSICSDNNERVSKFLLDAIPMTGTTESLKLMTQLIVKKHVTGLEADMWLTTLAFIQSPTLDMLTEVRALLSIDSNEAKAMLSVSSLVHSYCSKHGDCENTLEVRKIINLLQNKIGQTCKVTEANMNMALMALRAIGNAGYGTSAIPVLAKCIGNDNNPIEVRLSAVEAFRRIPCNSDKRTIMNLFTNTAEDSELRIAAYRALMECPSDIVLSKVKYALEREEVNQVGSYVWSHLTNLMETSDPHKQGIRAILEDETLQKEFDLDKRKFSRNYEGSLFIEKLNTGATLESDLIWSSKSFIPRSAMVNLTVDLFGSAVNLFEIGGRVEGLEYFLESYFGPNGYFSENDVQAAADKTALKVIKQDKAKRITKRMETVMDELKGSLYMRVFGNELRYMNFHGLDSLRPTEDSFNFLELLLKLSKENDYSFTQSATFLDSSIIIPTSSGFPMNLTVEGTATIDIKASGKMDVMKLSASPPSIDIHGLIRPSGAVEISSMMSVDAFVTKAGIKMVSTLHSSTSIQGKVELAEGKVLNVQFDLPDEKMDIISVKSSFFTVHRDLEREQKMITDNRKAKSICTGERLAKITGLELCGELQFPNASMTAEAPYFPITGPVSMGISLVKRDSMTSYKLEARSTHTGDQNIVRLAFSAPGSRINRNFGVDFNLNKAQGSFDSSFTSPWKNAEFKGTVTNTKAAKGFAGKLNWDSSIRYDINALVEAKRSGPGMMYTPTIQIRVPGGRSISLGGSLKYAAMRLLDLDLALEGVKSTPMSLKASLINKPTITGASASIALSKNNEYSFESNLRTTLLNKKATYSPHISVRTPTQEVFAFGGDVQHVFGNKLQIDAVLDKIVSRPVTFKGVFAKKEYRRGRKMYNIKVDMRSSLMDMKLNTKFDNRNWKALSSSVDLTYVIRKVARNNVKLAAKIINLSTKTLTKARCTVNMNVKRNPELNFKLLSNLYHNNKHSEIDADFMYGAKDKDPERKISASMSLDRAIKSWESMSVAFSGLVRKGNDLRIGAKMAHKHDKQALTSSMSLKYNKNTIDSSLTLADRSAERMSLSGEYTLDYPGKKISIVQTITETEKDRYTSSLTAQIGKSKNSIVTKWIVPSANALSLTSSVTVSTMKPITLEAAYNFKPQLYSVSGLVQNGPSKYSAKISSQIDLGNTILVSADIDYPSRHIISSFEGTKAGERYTSRTDVRWNAERDDSHRLTVTSNGVVSSSNNIEGSVTVQYPSRTIALNLKHVAGNKYVTHADFQWESGKTISIDTSYSDYKRPDNREVVGGLKLRTPFKDIRSLDLTMNHQIDDKKYKSKLDAEWNPSKIVSATVTLRRPLTLSSIDAEIIAKTPLKSFKTATATLSHKIRNGLTTLAKFGWNKQSMQADVSFSNKGSDSTTNVKGQIDIKTTFRNLKVATVTVSHKSNIQSCETAVSYVRNKRTYGLLSEMKHNVNGWDVANNGKVVVSTPSDSIQTVWDHSNTLNGVASSVTTTWGKERIYVKYNGRQEFQTNIGSLSSALEIQTPFDPLRDIVFQITHEHRPGQIDTNLKLSNEGSALLFGEGIYRRQNGQVTSSFVFTNPIVSGDTSVKMSYNYEKYPRTGHLEIQLSPDHSIIVDGSFDKDSTGNIDTTLEMRFPYINPIVLKASRNPGENGVTSIVHVEYAPGKVIAIESFHRLDSIKQIKLKVTSPFSEPLTSEVKVQRNNDAIRLHGSIEAQPLIKSWSMTASLENGNGVRGNVRINTPYPEFAYSQISIESSTDNGPRRSVITIEYTPRSEIQLICLSNIRNPSDMDATVTLVTPFTNDISATFSHSGIWKKFQTHGQLTYGKSIAIGIQHEGSLKEFRSGIELTIDGSRYTGEGQFSYDPNLATSVTLSTPITNWENVRFSHSLDGSLLKFTHHAELSHSGFGTYSSDVSLNRDNIMSGEARIQTPISGFRNMRAVLLHDGSWKQFRSRAEFHNGNSIMSGDMKLNTDPIITFEASLVTPFTNIELAKCAVSHEGNMIAFKSHAEAQINKITTGVDLVFNADKKIDADLTLRTSFMRPFKASVDHWGTWKKFTTKIRARQGNEKVSSEIKFQLNPTFNVMASLKTPFKFMKNHQLSLKHAGSSNNFKCNMQYRMNGNVYSGDASLDNINALRTELNLKGVGFRPIGVLVSHDGSRSQFQSSAELSYGQKKIQLEADVNAVNDLSGKVALTTPIPGMESINAVVSHTGTFKNFRCHGEVNYGKDKVQGDALFDMTNDITASVSMSSPLNGYADVSSSFKHMGTLSDFRTEALYRNGNNKIEGSVSFSNGSAISGSASIKSTFPSVDNYALLFLHQGQSNNFKTHGELTVGKYTTEGDVVLDLTKGIDASLTAKSPLIRDTVISVKHTPSPTTLSSYWNIVHGGVEKFSIQTDFNADASVGGRIRLLTPFNGFETSEVSLNHDGTMDNFRTQAELMFRNQKHEMDMSLRAVPDIDGSFTMNSPLFKTVQTTVTYSGKPTDFKSTLKCTYGLENMLNIQTGINVDGPFRGDISVTSPIIRDIQVTFSHDGQPTALEYNAKLIYGGKLSEGKVAVIMNDDIDVSMSLITPCMRDISVTFGHTGPITNCKTTSDVSYGGVSKFNLDSSINTESAIDSRIRMLTTIPGLRNMEANIHHTGPLSNFRSHGDISVEGTTVIGDVSFSPREGMLRIKSPMSNDIDGSFSLNGQSPNIQGEAELSYGAAKLLDFRGNMQSPMNGDITIKTPIKGFENTHLAIKHTGDRRQFESHAEITINGATSAADVSVNTVDLLKGSIGITSPMITPIAANVVYDNGALNARSKATITYGNDQHTATFNRNMNDRYAGEVTVTSPLIKDLYLSIDSNANIYQLETSAAISYGGNKLFGLGMSTNTVNALSGSVSVDVPSNTAQLEMNIDGTPSNFIGHAALTINGEATELDTTLNVARDISGSISFRSPFTRHHVLKINANGKPINFKSHMEASCDSDKTQLDLTFNIEGRLDSSVSLRSPMISPVSMAVSFSGEAKNFVANALINVANNRHTVDASLNSAEATEGKLTVSSTSIAPLSVGFRHVEGKGNFHSHAELNIDNANHELDISLDSRDSITGSLVVRSPTIPTVSTSIDYKGDISNFQSHVEVNIDAVKHELDASLNIVNDVTGSISVKSPLIKTISSRISYTGEPRNFRSHAELNIDSEKHELDISLDSYNKIESILSLTSPSFAPVSAVINHSGILSNFQSSAELNIGKDKHVLDANFRMGNEISGRIHGTCPYSEDLTVGFTTTTELTNIKSQFEVVYGEDKTVDINLAVDTDTSLSGSLSVIIPGNNAMAEVSLNGSPNDFNGKAKLSMNGQTAQGDITFSTKDNINGRTTLILPGNNLELSFEHEGGFNNFATSGEFVRNGKKSDGRMSFNIETSVEGHLSFTSPVTKDVKASFQHNGPAHDFRSHAAISYGQMDLFNGNINLRKEIPIRGAIQMSTPIPGYESMSAVFTHETGDMSLKNHAEISVNAEKTEVDISVNMGSKFEGIFSATSPYFSDINSKFAMSGKPTSVHTYVEYIYGEKKYAAEIAVNTISDIDGSITITTPTEGMRKLVGKLSYSGQFPNFNALMQVKNGRRNIVLFKSRLSTTNGIDGQLTIESPLASAVHANFNHKGHIFDFNSNAELRMNGHASVGSIAFATTPTVEGSISASTPFLNDVAANFKIGGKVDNFNAHAEGRLEGKVISVDLSVSQSTPIGATINVKTPFYGYESMQAGVKLTKKYMGFSSHAELEISPGRKIELDGEASWRSSIEGSISLKTPYEGFHESHLQFSHTGRFPSMRSDVVVRHQGKEYAVHANLQHQYLATNGKLTITTPFPGYETVGLSFNTKGDIRNIQADAEVIYATGHKMSVSLYHKLGDQHVETRLTVDTPYTELITYNNRYNTDPTDFSCDIHLSVGEHNSLSHTTTFKLEPTSMILESKTVTVIAGSSNEHTISVKYEGTPINFKSSASASIFGSKFSADASFKAETNIEGQISLKTPFEHLKDVALSLEHSGNLRRFSTKIELQYEQNKKIEGTVQYVKYGWRRLQTSIDVRTPFDGYDRNRISYRHTASVDSFECDADAKILNKDLTGTLRASMSPISASVTVNTPFREFEQIGADFKLGYDSQSYNTETNIAYMQGKTISVSSEASIKSSPKSAVLSVTTPFAGYEHSEIRVSHVGDLRNFQSTVSANVPFVSVMRAEARLRSESMMDMDGTLTFTSQLRGFENLKLVIANKMANVNLDNRVEVSWSPSKSIVFGSEFHGIRQARTIAISLTTPFESVKELILTTKSRLIGTKYTETVFAQFNGEPVYDIDIDMDYGFRKYGSVLMRSPKAMQIKLAGSLRNGKYEGDGLINMNTKENGNQATFEGSLDTANGNIFTFKHMCSGFTIVLNGAFEKSQSHADFSYNAMSYGYEMILNEQDGRLKVKLPSRSLQISGMQGHGATEGSFMWDADRDDRKAVGFRSVIAPSDDSVKADVTLMLPVIGKDVQLDSEVTLNRGRVLFDGKTELTYSKDSEKKFTLTSRLEDISNDIHSKNYSFSVSISHPHTSVGVELRSHVAKSDERMSGAVDMKYLTVRRETKTFAVNGQIDRLKRNFKLNVNTPVKKVSIDGNTQLEDPFRVSVVSKYDSKRPFNTVLTVNPAKRMVDFQMNYDLENPANELHINAKYVNSSAVLAEMFRMVNRQKITDALVAVRLSSPRLMNTRLHWRPSMINDLKEYQERKSNIYKQDVKNAMGTIGESVRRELGQKARMISESTREEVEPVVALYENNDYYLKDIVDAIVQTSQKLGTEYSGAIREYVAYMNDQVSRGNREVLRMLQEPMDMSLRGLEAATGYVTNRSSIAYGKYAGMVNGVILHPSVQDAKAKLVAYVNMLRTFPAQKHLSRVSDSYTSSIYNARELINARLSTLLNRESVKTVMDQGNNAYKYWEVRENAETIYRAIINWIKSEVEAELSDIIQAIEQYEKSMVTVYDPAHGEIQLKTYLPIPLKSLDVVPTFAVAPLITKAKRFIPKMPTVSLPSMDVSTWLPPHQAIATIEGDRITTFDGVKYELTGACTYLLAKDFVDGNFSLALRKTDEPTFIIMAGGEAVEILSNGTVRVNNVPVALPTKINKIAITSEGGVVTVDGAGNFKVEYASDLDRYVIHLSGWYYGKIGGLLGTYDNEPSNDLMTSYGRQLNTVDRFSRTWDIGPARCR